VQVRGGLQNVQLEESCVGHFDYVDVDEATLMKAEVEW